MNPTDLQVGPFHGMDNILISQHFNFLGSELDPGQQTDIVHHDGQAESPSALRCIFLLLFLAFEVDVSFPATGSLVVL